MSLFKPQTTFDNQGKQIQHALNNIEVGYQLFLMKPLPGAFYLLDQVILSKV